MIVKLKMKSHVILLAMLWCEIFMFILFIAGIILGSIGLSQYIKNHRDELTYRPWQTICLIENYSMDQCDCYSSGDYCPLVPCFNENYLVTYEISNQTRITSSIQTKSQSTQKKFQVKNTSKILFHKYFCLLKIGASEVCYYNGKFNVTSVKWTYEDKTLGFILFSIGYGISAIVFPLLMFILIILTIEHRHHQRQQRKRIHIEQFFNSQSDSCLV